MSSLGNKRLEAVLAIAGYTAGSGTASSAPTPCVEVPKQIVLTASDILMYTTIWKIYFEEDLTRKELTEVLTELGIVTVAAVGQLTSLPKEALPYCVRLLTGLDQLDKVPVVMCSACKKL